MAIVDTLSGPRGIVDNAVGGSDSDNATEAVIKDLLYGGDNDGVFVFDEIVMDLQQDGVAAALKEVLLTDVVGAGDRDNDLIVEEVVDDLSGGSLDHGDLGAIGELVFDAGELVFG